MQRDTVAILDFGSQYTQLIARRLRELQVYSEVLPPGTKVGSLAARGVKGIVLSGGPDSVYAKTAPRFDRQLFQAGLPVLACGLSDHYWHIFQITRLASFIQLFPDEATALAQAPA